MDGDFDLDHCWQPSERPGLWLGSDFNRVTISIDRWIADLSSLAIYARFRLFYGLVRNTRMKYRKLIVVGDPHISPKPGEHRGVDSAAVLERLIEHVNVNHADAEMCLFLGDLTNEGEPAAFKRFKSLIKPLNLPVALMVGNHDNRANFQAVFPDVDTDPNGFVQYVRDFSNDYRLIVLDTLNGPPYESLRRHVGMLSAERIDFLKNSLDEAAGRPVVIALHHHPFEIGLPGMDTIRLMNGPEFVKIVNDSPNVKMVLFGHNHRQISGLVQGVPFACFSSLSPQTPFSLTSLDPAGGIAESPHYGVVLLTPEGVLVHREDFTCTDEPSSNFDEQLANDPQMAAGIQMLAKAMLPDYEWD